MMCISVHYTRVFQLYFKYFKYIKVFQISCCYQIKGYIVLQVKKQSLQNGISSLIASGSTCLTAAIETATAMFTSVVEEKDSTNRIIFLTDLCSTVDSVNDEKKLLSTIQANAGRGIFTSVVGVGMVCCQQSYQCVIRPLQPDQLFHGSD